MYPRVCKRRLYRIGKNWDPVRWLYGPRMPQDSLLDRDILATTRHILAYVLEVVSYNRGKNGFDALEHAHLSSCASKTTTLSLISLQSVKKAKIVIRSHGRLHFMEYQTFFSAVPLVIL